VDPVRSDIREGVFTTSPITRGGLNPEGQAFYTAVAGQFAYRSFSYSTLPRYFPRVTTAARAPPDRRLTLPQCGVESITVLRGTCQTLSCGSSRPTIHLRSLPSLPQYNDRRPEPYKAAKPVSCIPVSFGTIPFKISLSALSQTTYWR
jgi:hypothetical protein